MNLESFTIDQLPQELLSQARAGGAAGVFYTRPLLELWEAVFRWQGVAFTDGETLLVGYRKSSPVGRSFYSLPFGWYGGFIGTDVSESLAVAVIDRLHREKFIQENIVQFGSQPGSAFDKRYRCRQHSTHILDLTTKPEYSVNTKRNIARAGSANLTIKELIAADSGACLQLLQQHVKLTGRKRKLPEAFYSKVFSLAGKSDSGIILLGVYAESELIACQVYFSNTTDIFYFDGFAGQKGQDQRAGFLLFDWMIERSRTQGLHRLNLGASPQGESGLVRFKESWGARAVSYQEYYRATPIKRALDIIRGRK